MADASTEVGGPRTTRRVVERLRGRAALERLAASLVAPARPEDVELSIISTRIGPFDVVNIEHSAGIRVEQRPGYFPQSAWLGILTSGVAICDDGVTQIRLGPGGAVLVNEPGWRAFTYLERASIVEISCPRDHPGLSLLLATRGTSIWEDSSPALYGLAELARTFLAYDTPDRSAAQRAEMRIGLEAALLTALHLAPTLPAAEGPDAGLLGSALRIIAERYVEPELCAADVAAAVGVSVRTLQRLFEGGRSGAERIAKMRLDHALRLLDDPACDEMTVDDVAAASGFSTSSALRRAVASHTGYTPAQYRRLLRTGSPAGVRAGVGLVSREVRA